MLSVTSGYLDDIHYDCCKNKCQKILPAHSVITKRDFILRNRYFCKKYTIEKYKNLYKEDIMNHYATALSLITIYQIIFSHLNLSNQINI